VFTPTRLCTLEHRDLALEFRDLLLEFGQTSHAHGRPMALNLRLRHHVSGHRDRQRREGDRKDD